VRTMVPTTGAGIRELYLVGKKVEKGFCAKKRTPEMESAAFRGSREREKIAVSLWVVPGPRKERHRVGKSTVLRPYF